MTRKKWFWPVIGVPGILMIVALLALSPILWSSLQAYRNVTVDNVEHLNSAFVPQLNQQGTPELVARATEDTNPGWTDTERITILLLGVDIAAGGASRTDTLIMVNIDPVEKTASMMSIPRDLKVVIPGYGVHKINAAFALGEFNKVQGGGAGLTIRTIESNLGIPIHGFVQIDFQGFVKMIDTVGGITVDVPYPIRDDEYPAENFRYQRVYFPAGWQHLDGEEALIYARTRHQDGDTMRSVRQQQVLMALRDQAVSLDLVTQLPTLIRQFGDSVRTDISIGDAVKLGQLGMDIPRDSITSVSIMPSLYEDPGIDGTYYLSADWTIAEEILSEFTGERISPPGAAISDPDYGASIMILNGTTNTGLAGRVGTTLESNGFWNVSVDNADNQGDHDLSMIVDRHSDLGTSAMITSLIGVGADTIVLGSAPETTDTTRAGIQDYSGYDIVIMLGNDTPDPAGDQWSLEDYQRETGGDEGTGAEPTSEDDQNVEPQNTWTEEDSEARPLEPVDEGGG
jgi:LCP family protein required for cell wall assembly